MDSYEVSLGTNINNRDNKYYVELLGVKVNDNYDDEDNLKLEFDASSVNSKKEGEYQIIIKMLVGQHLVLKL